MSRFQAMLGPSAASNHRTPQSLFARWQRQFAFTVDAAASAEDAMLARYWTQETDGLAQPWEGERVWCNPPYGSRLIEPWVAKASHREADVAVLFLPARPGCRWWRLWVQPFAFVRWLPFRVRFEGQQHNAPFDSCLAIYYPEDTRPWHSRAAAPGEGTP